MSAQATVEVKQSLTMGVTELAKTKLQQFLGDKTLDDVGVRIKVEPGGCSGAMYSMEFADAPADNETTLVANGVKLFIVPQQAILLDGVEVDFVDELMGGGFKIHNPNATSTCGCGKSFSA